ncbi:MAG: hypothetical protein LBQ37_04605 [Elusimicrobiota bacterium]|jgi:hypothetical protein|nr:hypothetical protein [Elusimicrobiota bacterium]
MKKFILTSLVLTILFVGEISAQEASTHTISQEIYISSMTDRILKGVPAKSINNPQIINSLTNIVLNAISLPDADTQNSKEERVDGRLAYTAKSAIENLLASTSDPKAIKAGLNKIVKILTPPRIDPNARFERAKSLIARSLDAQRAYDASLKYENTEKFRNSIKNLTPNSNGSEYIYENGPLRFEFRYKADFKNLTLTKSLFVDFKEEYTGFRGYRPPGYDFGAVELVDPKKYE